MFSQWEHTGGVTSLPDVDARDLSTPLQRERPAGLGGGGDIPFSITGMALWELTALACCAKWYNHFSDSC